MTNALRDKMVKELKGRQEGLTSTLGLVEEQQITAKGRDEVRLLGVRAELLSQDLTDIDEVLRLLEAR